MQERTKPEFYVIEPYQPSMAPTLATAAMRECGICHVFVSGSGGGGLRSLCPSCVEAIDGGMMRKFVDRPALKAWAQEHGAKNEVR